MRGSGVCRALHFETPGWGGVGRAPPAPKEALPPEVGRDLEAS